MVVVALALKLLAIKSFVKSMVVGSVFTYSLEESDEVLVAADADEVLLLPEELEELDELDEFDWL